MRLRELFSRIPKGPARNAFGLYLDAATSYLFPLITLPYLVRVLGPATFGSLAFCQSLVAYLGCLVEYGAALSGTRAAAAEADPKALSQLYGNVVLARMWLFLAAETLLLALVLAIPLVRELAGVLLPLSGILLAQALSPSWLYLGQERMAELARLNLLVNGAAVTAIFLFVRRQADLVLLAIILASGPLLGNVLALTRAARRWRLPWVPPRSSQAWQFLVEGFPLFLSTAATSLYTAANAFLLGLWATKEQVGFYSAAEKLVRAAQRALSPLATALIPHMVRTAGNSRNALFRQARGSLLGFLALGGTACLALELIAQPLIGWFLGPAFLPAVPALRLLLLILPMVAASGVLGFHLLLPLRRDRAFTATVAVAGALNVIGARVLTPAYGAVGMALAVVFSELWVGVAMLWVVRREGFSLFGGKRP